MHDNQVFLEIALHVGGEQGQMIPVSRAQKICKFAYFLSYSTAFFLEITVILVIGHMFIDCNLCRIWQRGEHHWAELGAMRKDVKLPRAVRLDLSSSMR